MQMLLTLLLSLTAHADLIGSEYRIVPQVYANKFIETTSPHEGFYSNQNRCWLKGSLVDPMKNLGSCHSSTTNVPFCELVVMVGRSTAYSHLHGKIENFEVQNGADGWGHGFSRASLTFTNKEDGAEVRLTCHRPQGQSHPMYFNEFSQLARGLGMIKP